MGSLITAGQSNASCKVQSEVQHLWHKVEDSVMYRTARQRSELQKRPTS